VDYLARRNALATMGHPKMTVTSSALRLRRRRPASFTTGHYTPVLAHGPARDHIVAFGRGADVIVAVTRWTVRLAEHGWGETILPVPVGQWHDWITGQQVSGSVPATALFASMPVALLERLDD
jgi:(1->4)-alpha-D-glucan 1-alpha-D-glucosylmutase